MKKTRICILYTGFAMVLLKNIVNDIPDDVFLTDVCSLVFTNNCEQRAPFQV
jgi:hypothetical protein